MKHVCIICEKEMKSVFDNFDHMQPNKGGEVRLTFDYGSRFDWLGARSPNGDGPIREVDFGDGPIKIKTSLTSSPSKFCLESSNRAEQLCSCKYIRGTICDDCFEKKAHLLHGYEESNPWTRLV